MRPWCIHFGGERNAKKNEKLTDKTVSSSKQQCYFPDYLVFFFKELAPQAHKKNKKWGKQTGEATTVVPGIRMTSRAFWITTNKLEARPAAKGRDSEGQTRRASPVLSRRATSPAPVKRKKCHYFSTSSRWDHEKTNLVFGDPHILKPGKYVNKK